MCPEASFSMSAARAAGRLAPRWDIGAPSPGWEGNPGRGRLREEQVFAMIEIIKLPNWYAYSWLRTAAGRARLLDQGDEDD